MMKIGLLISLLFPLYAQDFTYEDTRNKSASKYQRIGHIEKYLVTLDDKIKVLQKKNDRDLSKETEGLQRELTSLKKEVQSLKMTLVASMEKKKKAKGISEEKFKELEEKVKEQKGEIDSLKGSLKSLDLVLQSLKASLIKPQGNP